MYLSSLSSLQSVCRNRAYVAVTFGYGAFEIFSAVVKIDFTEGGFAVASPRAYRETVRCAFLSRRKTLENNFVNTFGLTRAAAKEILQAAGIPDGARGETLTPPVLGALSDLLVEKGVIQ